MNPITDARLSLVIPVFNEAENVTLLAEKIHEALAGYA